MPIPDIPIISPGQEVDEIDLNSYRNALLYLAGQTASIAVTLLHQNEGTDASAGAANVDTYPLSSQLTLKDSLRVLYTLEPSGGNVVAPTLHNITDNVKISELTSGLTLNAARPVISEVLIRRRQGSALVIAALQHGMTDDIAAVYPNFATYPVFITSWIGPWSMALRHGGISGGGILHWSLAIYKIAGQ